MLTDEAMGLVTSKEENPLRRIKSTLFGSRKRVVMTVIVVLALIAAAAGFAAWLISSQGGGRSHISSMTAPTVSPGSVSGSATPLTPGGTGDVELDINNPNGPLILTGVQPGTMTSQNFSPDETNCPNSNVTVLTLTGLSIPVPHGSSSIVVPNAETLSSSAPVACAGLDISKAIQASFATP
jgi:hypothetical protein